MLICRYLLHDLFYKAIRGGTIFNILFEDMHVVNHPALGVVWKACAVAGTHFIDAALVVFEIKELAGLGFIHPVALAVFVQPFITECFGSHTQVGGDAFDIDHGIGG